MINREELFFGANVVVDGGPTGVVIAVWAEEVSVAIEEPSTGSSEMFSYSIHKVGFGRLEFA